MRNLVVLLPLMLCFLSVRSQDSCSSNLALSELASYNLASFSCASVWSSQNFILRFNKTGPSLWTFVLSAPNKNVWVGMGFSKTKRMGGASAIIGWPAASGGGVIKQYMLSGYSTDTVLPDQGSLSLANSTIVSKSGRLYLAFQLKVDTPLSGIIYAVGPDGAIPSSNGLLQEHVADTSASLDYTTGQTSGGATSSPLKTSHGLLNMFAWCIIIPLGIIAARYCKSCDPAWFYTHLALQITGFALAIAGIVTGISLEDQVGQDVDDHKALGFVVLAMGCLQVTALLARPDKSSKVRKYWNWYHHWVGRIAIAIGIGNTFYGISLGGDGSWNIGLGIAIGVLGLTAMIMEVRKRMRK
ncbi:Cytochrome b561 and DOMON domain-containing protein [Nymphaea thermarum]|nr:Cytochrome b561 and DOMON domain-containing protein [Nymphaea thermarum]